MSEQTHAGPPATVEVRDERAAVVYPETRPAVTAMGWLRDWPDDRDYTSEDPVVFSQLAKAKVVDAVGALPHSVDLRQWFSPVENQGPIGSCTANAGVGVVEYFERRAFGRHIDGSRLFLYKATRNLLGWTGDTGAFLRSTMGALRIFGVPPEKFWPYVPADFDKEPSPFCYAYAGSYQALNYYRLDTDGVTRPELVKKIKTNLAAGLPSMFGFTVYSTIADAATTGKIPLPAPGERVVGGHAVVAAGFDDELVIRHEPSGPHAKGAFLIRNSWGTGWGQAGYGWLPYDYVLRGLAVDWWSLVKSEWLETGQFGF